MQESKFIKKEENTTRSVSDVNKNIRRSDGISITKEKNKSYNTFWNKVSFLIGNRKHKSYTYIFLNKLRIDNNIPTKPLLLKHSHQTCSECSTQVAEYNHNICFFCCTNDIESEEFNYNYKYIKRLLISDNWY